jgi:hypothetical protein
MSKVELAVLRNLTEEVWLESQSNACGICGRRCCPWIGFLTKTSVYFYNYTNHASYWLICHPGVGDGPIRNCSCTRYSRTPQKQLRKVKIRFSGAVTRNHARQSQELFSGCILLTQLSVAPQGQMCAEGGRGNRHCTRFLQHSPRLVRIQFNFVQPHRLLHVWSNWYFISRHRCCMYLI